MGATRLGSVTVTLAVGAGLALGLSGAALASSPGMVKSSG